MTQVQGNENIFAKRCLKRKLQSSAHDIRGSRRLSTLCDFMEVSSLMNSICILDYIVSLSSEPSKQATNPSSGVWSSVST